MIRAAYFNTLFQHLEGSRFLDVFAGTGSMGLEALSRGARHSSFIEHHGGCLKLLNENIKDLECKEQCQVLRAKVPGILEKLISEEKVYDLIFVDPPFDQLMQGYYLETPSLFASLLKKDGIVSIRMPENGPPFRAHQDLEEFKARQYGISILKHFRKRV